MIENDELIVLADRETKWLTDRAAAGGWKLPMRGR